jgi:hypothetical protein
MGSLWTRVLRVRHEPVSCEANLANREESRGDPSHEFRVITCRSNHDGQRRDASPSRQRRCVDLRNNDAMRRLPVCGVGLVAAV